MPLNEYQLSGDLNFTYVPMYGKFAGFGDFIFHYDAYVVGGVGIIRTEPIPVIDPDNRTFDWKTLVNFDVGIGLRIFFNRWLAAVLEVRDIMYFDQIENVVVQQGPAAKSAANRNSGTTRTVISPMTSSFKLGCRFSCRLPSTTGCQNENGDDDGDEAAFRQDDFGVACGGARDVCVGHG